MLLATLDNVSWAFKLGLARGFVILAGPLAASLTLLHRYTQRQLLHRARRRGQRLQTTFLEGHRGGLLLSMSSSTARPSTDEA